MDKAYARGLYQDYEDVPCMDCAGCGRPTVRVGTMALMPDCWRGDFQRLGGQIMGRPFCVGCLAPRPVPVLPATPDDPEGPSPWQDNAIRDLEGDR